MSAIDDMMEDTTITIENGYGTYSISVSRSDHSFDNMVSKLFTPVSLAMGYAPETIEECIGETE